MSANIHLAINTYILLGALSQVYFMGHIFQAAFVIFLIVHEIK